VRRSGRAHARARRALTNAAAAQEARKHREMLASEVYKRQREAENRIALERRDQALARLEKLVRARACRRSFPSAS
jgi:hypothetical protein